MPRPLRRFVALVFALVAALLAHACGGDGGGPGCEGPLAGGTFFPNAEVEPSFAVNPADPSNLIGLWQQDRYSNGGARGISSYVSLDAGKTWTAPPPAKFSRCTGGRYERASDPWISISPDGTAHQLALAFDMSGNGGNRAILSSRSTDGGRTWSDPAGLQVDVDPNVAVDKGAITADPRDASAVYAVWDRVTALATPRLSTGPAWFARSIDGGRSWQPAQSIYDPGTNAQTIGNIIAVLPDGTLLNVMQVITCNVSGPTCPLGIDIKVLRSTDKGATWPGPAVLVATVRSVGILDPKTSRPVRSGGSLPAIAVDPSTGTVYVAWEDSRFTANQPPPTIEVDGIVLSTSVDGGQTWSAPSQANRVLGAQAFTPALSAAGGRIAVSYYDARNDDPANTAHFLVSAWLAVSPDRGATWQESALTTAPFDIQTAPFAEGYFLGDYQGLASDGTSFLAFFAAANSGNTSDRTSILFRRMP